jgi:hypothetical protein
MHSETLHTLTAFRRGGKEAQRAAKHLRAKADLSEQLTVLQELPVDTPNLAELLTGVCIARDWTELWLANSIPLITNSQKFINWSIALFNLHRRTLQTHIDIRQGLENAVLQGNWTGAEEALQIHQRTIGPTVWALAWLLCIAEERGGSRNRREIVDRFAVANFGPATRMLAGVFSMSADTTMSDEHFRTGLADMLTIQSSKIRRFLQMLFFEDPDRDWQAWEILECSEALPLVDRYELFVRLTAIAVATAHSDDRRLYRGAIRCADFISDDYVRYLSEVYVHEEDVVAARVDAEAIAVWDAYIVSNYSESLRTSESVSQKHPAWFAPHELFVRSTLYLDRIQSLVGNSPVALMRGYLADVFSKDEQSGESLLHLRAFARRVRIPSISFALRAFHEQQSLPVRADRWSARAAYTMTMHGPRNFEFSEVLNTRYLAHCLNAYPESIALQFFAALAEGNCIPENIIGQIPEFRRLFFEGLAAARQGRWDHAIELLSKFLELQSGDRLTILSAFGVEEARRALIELFYNKRDVQRMQRTVVEAYLNRPASINRVRIDKIFDLLVEIQAEASRHIEFPIVAYLASDEPHAVTLALRRFLRHANARRPSDLIGAGYAGEKLAVLFLRVCTAEVLDSIPAFASVDDVEAERLRLLDWVAKNSKLFGRAGETEILRVTQRAQLRGAIQQIEDARVVLNVPGLREAEQERFSKAYLRFAAQRELGIKITEETLSSFRVVGRVGKAFVITAGDTGKLQESQDAELAAFAAAFRQVRDAFISSPHFGLDACLSGRIRHGIVIQHLRRPFVENKLAIKRDVPERKETEEFWAAHLGDVRRESAARSIPNILYELTDRVDALAEEVKDVWLQARTEDRNANGLFDYAFDDAELQNILTAKMRDVGSVDVFVDRILNALLERTRQSLRNVQERVRGDLRFRLTKPLDNAEKQVRELDSSTRLLPLQTAMASCRAEIERTCQAMARWFQNTDATLMGDVDFDLIARTAIGMVERLNPDFVGRHEIEVDAIFRVRGRYFTALVHMLFFLLDNAVRYSAVPLDLFQSKVQITSKSNQLTIGVENQTHSAAAALAAQRRIKERIAEVETGLDPAKVVREGGSGFAKIIAAVRYEFKQKDPILDVVTNGNVLRVSLQCEVAGLAA